MQTATRSSEPTFHVTEEYRLDAPTRTAHQTAALRPWHMSKIVNDGEPTEGESDHVSSLHADAMPRIRVTPRTGSSVSV